MFFRFLFCFFFFFGEVPIESYSRLILILSNNSQMTSKYGKKKKVAHPICFI